MRCLPLCSWPQIMLNIAAAALSLNLPVSNTGTSKFDAGRGAVAGAAAALSLIAMPAFAGDAALGESVFSGNCVACHRGGRNVIMPEKTLEKAALEEYLDGGFNEAAVVKQVSNGKNAMPAFGGRLSDDDISNVAACNDGLRVSNRLALLEGSKGALGPHVGLILTAAAPILNPSLCRCHLEFSSRLGTDHGAEGRDCRHAPWSMIRQHILPPPERSSEDSREDGERRSASTFP